jgi:hypothetical protein
LGELLPGDPLRLGMFRKAGWCIVTTGRVAHRLMLRRELFEQRDKDLFCLGRALGPIHRHTLDRQEQSVRVAHEAGRAQRSILVLVELDLTQPSVGVTALRLDGAQDGPPAGAVMPLGRPRQPGMTYARVPDPGQARLRPATHSLRIRA